MPSCVVKTCRNNTGDNKKARGITFHRFPSANDAWKNDWVQIIRECRNEINWNPTKSSVICSIHFDETDLYTTKGGLLRVVAYAVPKKCLFDTSTVKEGQPSEENNSSTSHEILSELPSQEQPTAANICNALEVILTELPFREDQPADENVSSSMQAESPTDERSSSEAESEDNVRSPIVTLKQTPAAVKIENSLSILSPAVTFQPPLTGDELEQDVSLLEFRKKRSMQYLLMKMHNLTQNQKKKIKTLNQKVRRLENRNKYLKNILKTLKTNITLIEND